MSELLNAYGKPMPPQTPSFCPQCGASEKHHTTVDAFGGYHRVLCLKCGQELSSWRDTP
jgi:transcription elongation factor Elf1